MNPVTKEELIDFLQKIGGTSKDISFLDVWYGYLRTTLRFRDIEKRVPHLVSISSKSIREREEYMKKGFSRFRNLSRLRDWNPNPEGQNIDFRWSRVQGLLSDYHTPILGESNDAAK